MKTIVCIIIFAACFAAGILTYFILKVAHMESERERAAEAELAKRKMCIELAAGNECPVKSRYVVDNKCYMCRCFVERTGAFTILCNPNKY